MPTTRLTIALNAKQSQKAPLIVHSSASSDPAATGSVQALVYKAAQTKLRLKKPSRVYVGGSGVELLSENDWRRYIRDDVVLLVSAGEEFVGVKKESSVHAESNPDCSVELLASKTPVDQLAVSQLEATAHSLPGIIHAVGQPDLHPGTKFPIGAVFVSRKWIHPPLIGSDIGCGMAWYKTTLSRHQVDGSKGKKVTEKLRGLEGPWRTQPVREMWLQEENGNWSAGEQWDSSLGTIGAGNHFAEIQVVEKSSSSALHENDVVLLVHSGSRGFGGSVLKRFTNDSQSSLKEGSTEATQYLQDHDKACQWAKANRDLIALRFLSCLEPGNEVWALGATFPADRENVDQNMIDTIKSALRQRRVVDIWHNNVERVKWPPCMPPLTEHSDNGLSKALADSAAKQDLTIPQEYVYVHRKGAAPTHDPSKQVPLELLPLPGSRGTPTLILKPSLTEPNAWGKKNAFSLAHGAGRAMSRAKALSILSQKYKGQNILEPRATEAQGTWVICDEKDLVFEEAPEAYKDVEAVGQDLVDAGAAEAVGWCRARISYKVRNEAR